MCEYCNQKFVKKKKNEQFNKYDNQVHLVSGGWTSVLMGLNEQGEFVLRGCGEDYTDDIVINYCPFCGRKLTKDKKE